MSFGKRLTTLLVLIAVVPTATVLLIVAFVGGESRAAEADAVLIAARKAATVLYGDGADAGRIEAARLALNPRFGAVVGTGELSAIRSWAQKVVQSGPVRAIEVRRQNGTSLIRVGDERAMGFGEIELPITSRRVATLAVSTTSAGPYAVQLRRMTGREVTLLRGSTKLAGTVIAPAGLPALDQETTTHLRGQSVRVSLVNLDIPRGERLLIAGPAQEGLLASIPGPVLVLVAGFVLLVISVALLLAREMSELHADAVRQSRTDPLTGLANRRRMGETLNSEIERAIRFGHSVSLLILDVDDFKQVNDRHGHMTGDIVLTELAAIIDEETRGVDAAGRNGGDELSVILPQTGPEGARELAVRLGQAVRAREIVGRGSTHVGITISVGVASLPQSAADAESLVVAADGALYEAKRHGRDQARVAPSISDFDPLEANDERPRNSYAVQDSPGRDRLGRGE